MKIPTHLRPWVHRSKPDPSYTGFRRMPDGTNVTDFDYPWSISATKIEGVPSLVRVGDVAVWLPYIKARDKICVCAVEGYSWPEGTPNVEFDSVEAAVAWWKFTHAVQKGERR